MSSLYLPDHGSFCCKYLGETPSPLPWRTYIIFKCSYSSLGFIAHFKGHPRAEMGFSRQSILKDSFYFANRGDTRNFLCWNTIYDLIRFE